MNENIIVIRSIPLQRFNQFIMFLHSEDPLKKYHIMAQKNIADSIKLRVNMQLHLIEPGVMRFSKCLNEFTFFKYGCVIIPVHQFDIENYFNIILFAAGNISRKYRIYFSDFTFIEYSFISFFILIITITAARISGHFCAFIYFSVYYIVQKLKNRNVKI